MCLIKRIAKRFDKVEGGVCADAEAPDGPCILRDFGRD